MKLQQPIIIAGLPYSGVNTATDYISKAFGFSRISYDSLINGIYNDLLTIFQFESQCQRGITKSELVLKHCMIIERMCYSSIENNAQYVHKWLDLIEDNKDELIVKKEILYSLNKLFSYWRVKAIKEEMANINNSGIIITNPFNQNELEFFTPAISIWVESPQHLCLQRCFKKESYNTEVYDENYLNELHRLKYQANFIIYNKDNKTQLYNQIHKLMKEVLRFETICKKSKTTSN